MLFVYQGNRVSVYGQVEDVKKFLEDPAAYAAANPVAAAPAAGGGGGEAKKEEKKVGCHTSDVFNGTYSIVVLCD